MVVGVVQSKSGCGLFEPVISNSFTERYKEAIEATAQLLTSLAMTILSYFNN